MEKDRRAARWVELSERIAVCGRLIGAAFAPAGEPWELTPAQLSLLLACRHDPTTGTAQTELARRLGVSPAHVSAQVESLRRRNLLEGRRPTYDRRRQLWRLTERGAAVLDTVLAQLAPRVADLIGRIGVKQFDQLHDLLDLLQTALQHPETDETDGKPKLQSFTSAHRSNGQSPVPPPHGQHPRRAAS